MLINDPAFFASLRARNSRVFGTSLSQRQVDGCNRTLTEHRTITKKLS